MKKIGKILLFIIGGLALVDAVFFLATFSCEKKLTALYNERQSQILEDRHGQIIKTYQNPFGNYALREADFPLALKKLIIQKEDKYFYYHLGINPISTLRALTNLVTKNNKPTASTITQQLVKILFNQETERNFTNKIKEIIYASALELHASKEEILDMYLNTIFLGNKTEGLKSAGLLYFGKSPSLLTNEEQLQLLATLNNPSNNNPFFSKNIETAQQLAQNLGPAVEDEKFLTPEKDASLQAFHESVQSVAVFEIDDLKLNFENNYQLTIDNELSDKVREIAKNDIVNISDNQALNIAVVIISTGKDKAENELIAIIGSPDPALDAFGYKINMAVRPRAIGSTIKPFIYTKGFSADLRPYTLVDDREYKYTIGTGFAFYPKNYDYEYRGLVNLHYALSNSLNVPSVKVLEYVGLENFNNFLTGELDFKPVQDINNYQLGIALGELEMDLLTLARYFTVFPNDGVLKPLKISDSLCLTNDGNKCPDSKKIFDPQYVALTNKILSDRVTGIEEFGIKSNLNLPFNNYAVKTGTSREYHDSWTVGYTPDFVVGVWVGNAADTAMDKISGQTGAGKIWQDTMNLLYNSAYNQKNKFDFSHLKNYPDGNNLNIGLANDNYEVQKNLLQSQQLILSPHDYDEFLFEDGMTVSLKAGQAVEWIINDEALGRAQETSLKITAPGEYRIKASGQGRTEEIRVFVNEE